MVLDIHFSLQILDPFLSEQSSLLANALCEKALRAYFTQNKNMNVPLKSGDWYEARVTSVAFEVGKNYPAFSTIA